MPATLMSEFTTRDRERLSTVLTDLRELPEQLAERRKALFRDAAMNDKAEELHAGRDEYRPLYDGYVEVAERFQALAETVGSPLATEFERVAEAVRRQCDDIFARWDSLDGLREMLIEHIQLTNEQLAAYAKRFPAPQSWYDETTDPFTPAE